MGAPVEHEIKLPVPNLDEVRSRLPSLGAVRRSPPTDEENWVLDDAGATLAQGAALLRVRRYGGVALLTYKGRASFAGGIKSRDELECVVGDAATLLAIFERLGFLPIRRYQKRREEWDAAGLIVALDETPMGCFVEIEGEVDRLAAAARALGLDPACAVPGSYLDLWERYRVAHPDAPRDMVFR